MTEFKEAVKRIGYLKHCLGKEDIQASIYLDGKFAHAMNGITGIKVPLETDIQTIVAGKKFIDTLGQCKNWPSMKLTNSNLIVKDGNLRVLVPIIEDKIFPTFDIPLVCLATKIDDSAKFIAALNKLKPYASSDITRAALNCIAFRGDCIYAANGTSMAWQKINIPELNGLLLPVMLIDVINKLPGIEAISRNDKTVYFNIAGGLQVKSALIEGKYPDIESVIPNVPRDEIQPVTHEIVDAINKIIKLSDDTVCVFDNDSLADKNGSVVINNLGNFKKAAFNTVDIANVINNVNALWLQSDITKPSYFTDNDGFEFIAMPVG